VTVALDWGPASGWAAALATLLVAVVAVVVALGVLESFRGPRLRITFEGHEPWCRTADRGDGGQAYWVRLGVENVGRKPARGCIGRLISVATDGAEREDVDPVQLRWAGVPRSSSFRPIDLRPREREFLNVLTSADPERWRIVTFEDDDFDPGFPTVLELERVHVLRVALFSDNAETRAASLLADGRQPGNVVLAKRA
jgi:hypothetical protein